MFKYVMSLILCCACCVPQSAKATDCHANVRQEVVFNDDYHANVEYVYAVPHQKVVERVVINEYDYAPVAVERIVEVQKIVKQHQRVNRVQKIVKNVRGNRQNVKRVRIVERQEVHY